MRIEIRARQFTLTEAIRDHAEKRLASAVGPHKEHVAEVTMTFGDENGPKGGPDKTAHVTASVEGKVVVIDERDANLYAAIDRAMDRLQESVRRTIEKKRDRIYAES